MNTSRHGFTLVETIAVLMVFTVGLASAFAIFAYGNHVSKQARSIALAYATARSVLVDSKINSPGWDSTLQEGWVNGIWIRRTVTDSNNIQGLTFATVTVEAFNGLASESIFTLRERLCFHAP